MKIKNSEDIFLEGFKDIFADYCSKVLLAKENNKIDSLNERLVSNLRKILAEYDLNKQRYQK